MRTLDEAIPDLEGNGLIPGEDCIYFELTLLAMVGRESQEMDLGLNSLSGCGQDHGLMVRYVAPGPRVIPHCQILSWHFHI